MRLLVRLLLGVLVALALFIAWEWLYYRPTVERASSGSNNASVLQELLDPRQKALFDANEEQRFQLLRTLITQEGRTCRKVTRAFFQGIDSLGTAYWSVTCFQGESLSVRLPKLWQGSTMVFVCDPEKGSSRECFRPLSDVSR